MFSYGTFELYSISKSSKDKLFVPIRVALAFRAVNISKKAEKPIAVSDNMNAVFTFKAA